MDSSESTGMNRRQVLTSSIGFVTLTGCLETRPRNDRSGMGSPAPVKQTAPARPLSIQWTREYGAEGGESTHTPNGSPAIRSRSLVRAANDGYALTGQQSEQEEPIDGYLQVTDAGGETQWLREYGGKSVNTQTPIGDDSETKGSNRAYCITRTSDSGFLLVGGQPSATNGVSFTGWYLKVDASGDPEWYGGPADGTKSALQSAVETEAGNYALTGWIKGSNGIRGWFVKLDSAGETLVEKTYDTAADDPHAIAEEFEAITESSDGGFVHVGEYVDGGWLLKVDGDGNKQWETFLDASYVKANDVIETSDGNYLVAGRVTNDDQNPQYTVTEEKNPSDLALTLVDGSGTVQWTKTYNGGGNEFGMAVVATADGGFAAVGGRTRQREQGVFLVKTDSEGAKEWSETYLVDESVVGRDLVQATDGGFAIAAETVFLKVGPE